MGFEKQILIKCVLIHKQDNCVGQNMCDIWACFSLRLALEFVTHRYGVFQLDSRLLNR